MFISAPIAQSTPIAEIDAGSGIRPTLAHQQWEVVPSVSDAEFATMRAGRVGNYLLKTPLVIVWLPLASMASTSKPWVPRLSDAKYSGGMTMLVAEPGSVT